MLGNYIGRTTTVLTALAGGALLGSLLNGFGHFRHLYTDNDRQRTNELKRLQKEDSGRLKKRIVIGCVLGAIIGTAAGVMMSQLETHDED